MEIKKYDLPREITPEKIVQINLKMKEQFELDLYNFQETESALVWTLKDEYLENTRELIAFLIKQYSIYYPDYPRPECQEILDTIADLKNAEAIVAFAKEKRVENFQYVKEIMKYIQYGYNHTSVWCKAIAFFIDGKIMMECYNYIFHYFETMIKENNQEFEIAKAVKIWITL